ncbi:uncharacterized protein A4U43_C06F530 [Asparagus officinalis]|uniref:CRAL-TRIO domain-containing protein n=1 Tax=Asparagus officinalis TaxID=4686 RepID=A0A5P1ELS8_ASPOF|nr:patellin-4 [Asparagus officinalis]ONK65749.1 uncharacterized protein A4U43_C06F530 [Asparagus officinalis]
MTVEVKSEKSESTQAEEVSDSPKAGPVKATGDPLKEQEAEEEKPNSSMEEEESEEQPNPSIEEKKSEEPILDSEVKKPEDEPKPEESSDSAKVIEKSSSFKEESNFLSDLKELEKKALIELKAKLEEAILEKKLFKNEEAEPEETQEENEGKKSSEEIDKDPSLWGVPLLPSKNNASTDVILLKFLQAREFKVKESFEMLQNTLKWRKDESIDSVVDETELGSDFERACYMDGCDREGHPVCYNIPAVFKDEEFCKKALGSEEGRKKFLRWRIQVMEKEIQKLDLRPGGVCNLLQVTDLKDSVGVSKKELRDTMKQALQTLQDNYPEFVSRNIFINVPFWYYAFHALISPFFTQRTKSKFVFARPANATETLLKYIPAEAVPIRYGGFKRDNDTEFSVEDGAVSELTLKSGSTETIEFPAPEVGTTLIWDLSVLGWEVTYKGEFVPTDEGSYTVIIQKGKKMGPQEETVRNSFTSSEPGKVVVTIENKTYKKKRALYRYKAKSSRLDRSDPRE